MKRFNCVNNRWVKSQKAVHFPFDDFDPTPYLASVPQETILRHNDLKMRNSSMAQCKEETEDDIVEEDHEIDVEVDNNVRKDIEDYCGNSIQNEQVDSAMTNSTNVINKKNSPTPQIKNKPRKLSTEQIFKRKRLISTSLSKSPILDDELKDYHNHNLKSGADPLDLKYKLYAVVVS